MGFKTPRTEVAENNNCGNHGDHTQTRKEHNTPTMHEVAFADIYSAWYVHRGAKRCTCFSGT